MKNLIAKQFKSNFNDQKVRTDLFNYLNKMCFEYFNGKEYIFEVSEINDFDKPKIVKINSKDELTIYDYWSRFRFDTDLHFYINVAIGKFTPPNDIGLWKIEKCSAFMKYNEEFDLYDIEFSYSLSSEFQ